MNWPQVPLGEVLTHRKDFIQIDDLMCYKRCRVQLHAQGIVLRDTVSGVEIKTKKQQVCRPDEFLVAEIDAKLGGYGIVPGELDGAVVSSHYFLFEIDRSKLERDFLGYFIRTPAFAEQVAAQGSTNYAAIRPGHVLEYKIPLPALSEQRRIVSRLDVIASRVAEARRLREEVLAELDALVTSAGSTLFSEDHIRRTVVDLIPEDGLRNGFSPKPAVLPTETRCLTLAAMRKGLIDCKEAKFVELTGTQLEQYQIRAGDVFIIRGNGSKQLVGLAGLVDTAEPATIFPDLFIRIELDQSLLLPRYFVAVWNSKIVRDQIETAAKTTSGIWKVNQGHICSTSLPVPPLDGQRRIVAHLDALQAKLDAVRAEQSATAAELDALLPSVLNRAFAGEL